MDFSSMFNKNVLNQKSYKKMLDDGNGAYKIIISPKTLRKSGTTDTEIKGILTEEVSLDFKADYQTFGFGGLLSNSQWLETAYKWLMMPLRYQGRNLDNVGIVTKKFYVKSGYLNLNPSFRIVDWYGDNMPLKAAKALISYCLPQKEKNLEDVKENLIQVEKDLTSKLKYGKIIDEGLKIGGEFLEGASEIGTQTIDSMSNQVLPNTNMGSTGKQAISEGFKNGFWLTSSPTPISLTIGNWFYHENMVIEDVNVKFSKEMTKFGPLYVDVSLAISSVDATSIDEEGFQFHGQKRVYTNLDTGIK